MIHRFLLDATWNGGRNSTGTIETGNLTHSISIPKEMGGPGIGTNPDEMLLGAAATCFLITYAAMLERAQIAVESLTLHAEADVDVTNNVFEFRAILHFPTVVLREQAQAEKAERLAFKAESSCMITKAVAGNVAVSVTPNVKAVDSDE